MGSLSERAQLWGTKHVKVGKPFHSYSPFLGYYLCCRKLWKKPTLFSLSVVLRQTRLKMFLKLFNLSHFHLFSHLSETTTLFEKLKNRNPPKQLPQKRWITEQSLKI